jgi:hypothetical protein
MFLLYPLSSLRWIILNFIGATFPLDRDQHLILSKQPVRIQ